MYYIGMVNDAIQYIESNLNRIVSLEELASRYYLSPIHFYRIFRAVTNRTVKSYILERKLSEAAITLRKTDRKVLDIAFQYGFNSHEVFTRSFAKMFRITPNQYRKENISVSLTNKLDIVERDFRNKNNDLIVDYSCREIKEIRLLGNEILFHPEISCEAEEVIHKILNYALEHFGQGRASKFFIVIRLDHSDLSRIFCFYGVAAEEYRGDRNNLEEKIIPGSKYTIFMYSEGLGLIFHTVRDDLKKWFKVSELEFNDNAGIRMFELYTVESVQTGKHYLYVPLL